MDTEFLSFSEFILGLDGKRPLIYESQYRWTKHILRHLDVFLNEGLDFLKIFLGSIYWERGINTENHIVTICVQKNFYAGQSSLLSYMSAKQIPRKIFQVLINAYAHHLGIDSDKDGYFLDFKVHRITFFVEEIFGEPDSREFCLSEGEINSALLKDPGLLPFDVWIANFKKNNRLIVYEDGCGRYVFH